MFKLIATIIFTGSLIGIAFILYKKIPALIKLPQNTVSAFKKGVIVLKIEDKIKDFSSLFSKQIILHKILSFVKCLTLKIETQIDNLLHRIREKAQEMDKEASKKKQ